MGSLRKGSKRVERPVVEVLQDQEPAPFVSCFHGWCDWKLIEKPYIDPRRVRMEVRRSMGLLGDMAPLIGKPIEGLTLAQAEVLSNEYKKQQAKIKKKEALKSPEKDSIRSRLRKARMQLLDQQNPAPPPKVVIADASYRSPYCVPPPPHILKGYLSSSLRTLPYLHHTVAMEEYALASESIADHYPQFSRESLKSEKLESSLHVFPIPLSEIQGNKLTPILERQSSIQSIHLARHEETSHEGDLKLHNIASRDPHAPSKSLSSTRSLSRHPSQPYSPAPSTRSIGTSKPSPRTPITPTTPQTPTEPPHSKPTLHRPSETITSKLRRDRSKSNSTTNSSASGGVPFGFSKSSALKTTSIPNSPAEPLQKAERKPYIDYLRKKPSPSPSSSTSTPTPPSQSVPASASASEKKVKASKKK